MLKCKHCGSEISTFKTRKCMSIVVKKKINVESAGTHYHYGNPNHKYGICSKNHYTFIERVNVDWNSCLLCVKQEQVISKKAKFLMAKARKAKKEIPSFLRRELDDFKQQMESKMESLIDQKVGQLLVTNETKIKGKYSKVIVNDDYLYM